jgi:hypothetical protein
MYQHHINTYGWPQLPEKDILGIISHGQGHTQSVLLQLFAPIKASKSSAEIPVEMLKGKDGEKSTLRVRFTVARAFIEVEEEVQVQEVVKPPEVVKRDVCIHGNFADGQLCVFAYIHTFIHTHSTHCVHGNFADDQFTSVHVSLHTYADVNSRT